MNSDTATIQQIIDAGFKMIWFDGNRGSAKREYIKRGYPPVAYFKIQLEKIEASSPQNHFVQSQVNTFDAKGNFKTKKQICNEILAIFNEESDQVDRPIAT